jgi:adenine C2-methylase RlmN of 23S rRNA A2503 and tRNA A37
LSAFSFLFFSFLFQKDHATIIVSCKIHCMWSCSVCTPTKYVLLFSS